MPRRFLREFRGADVEETVNLHRVAVDDFARRSRSARRSASSLLPHPVDRRRRPDSDSSQRLLSMTSSIQRYTMMTNGLCRAGARRARHEERWNMIGHSRTQRHLSSAAPYTALLSFGLACISAATPGVFPSPSQLSRPIAPPHITTLPWPICTPSWRAPMVTAASTSTRRSISTNRR